VFSLRNVVLFLIILILFASAAEAAGQAEHYFQFTIDSPKELSRLTQIVSIAEVRGDSVWAFANDRELARFESLGYAYKPLPHPSSQISPRMAPTAASASEAWDSYPTYGAYVSMMNQFELDYPGICQIVSAGTTVQGRQILFAVISDNVGTEEDEPEVMHTSTMHGNETVGYVLMLRLIDSILVSYGTDPAITRLVDSCEIWINPLANPDGTYRTGDESITGATRANANGVDLNRNFPDPAEGDHPDGNLWQPETIAMMTLAEAHSFTISANHHSGTEVVNYPWDTWYRRHADDAWYQDICHLYADTAQAASFLTYMTGYNNGITNGYDWYRVTGGRQDYMIYERRGREVTVELSEDFILPAAQLPTYWAYNRKSLVQYLENALNGIRGIVTDAQSGLPLQAAVKVLGHDKDNSEVWTDPDVGDYHRMIETGTYDLVYSSEGYFPDTVFAATAVDFQSTVLNVALTPLPLEPLLLLAGVGLEAVDAGDTVSTGILIENIGLLPAAGVSGTLITSDPFVTITQPISTYPALPELGGSGMSSSEYELVVSPVCPFGHDAAFDLLLTADGGYLDTLSFTITIGRWVEDFETADFGEFPWQFAGSNNWLVDSSGVYEGAFCARSGSISHGLYSELLVTLEITESGEMSFYYTVSSEAGWDFLLFSIDGQQKDAWSGEVAWTKASYQVDPGLHTFAWRYQKDDNTSSGNDRGLIDLVIFPPMAGDLAVYSSGMPDWTIGRPYSQQLTTVGGTAPFTWSDVHGDLTATGLTLSSAGLISGTPTSTGQIQFSARVEDAAAGWDERLLSMNINELPTITTDSISRGRRDEPFSLQLTSSGGTPPYLWTDRDGDLAGTGLALSPDGRLTGVPVSTGIISFTARLEDASGAVDEQAYAFEIILNCCVGLQGNINCDIDDVVDIADVQVLVDHLFLTLTPLCCVDEADLDQNGGVDITDLQILIDNQFISLTPLSECPQ